jgi:radical SAM superfamily enzyme YgiQ (UPF0313 family)
MRTVLFSTYELGRQPFGLASAAAWLRRAGADVTVHDLAVHSFHPGMLDGAEIVGVYVPMHTATRLAEPVIERARAVRPDAHIVAFGLYASMNEARLSSLGADSVIAGEFEEPLVGIFDALRAGDEPVVPEEPVRRQRFIVPDRSGLPALGRYARLQPPAGPERVVGYTEATRGCKHLCRHCPIVPVYEGRFVVVDPEVVLADVRAQVAAGADHITFGDPDFFNGPAHAMRVVRAMHAEFPALTYDVTIKVEHLARHLDLLSELRDTGCVLVTTAVESFDPGILDRFDKRHDPADFETVLSEMRRIGLAINPTFVAFTPWTTIDGYLDFLSTIARLGLVGNVAPVQYGIRLLIPAGSRLLELSDLPVDSFDDAGLAHPWSHPDPAMDRLQEQAMEMVGGDAPRDEVFRRVWEAARAVVGADSAWPVEPPLDEAVPIATVPYLTEPWYC